MDYTEKTARCIFGILRSQPFVFMSWGINPATVGMVSADSMSGLQFSVNGFKHKGTVQVLYNEGSDLFEVRLLNPDGSLLSSTPDVYNDSLVNTVDKLVERTDDYISSILDYYDCL